MRIISPAMYKPPARFGKGNTEAPPSRGHTADSLGSDQGLGTAHVLEESQVLKEQNAAHLNEDLGLSHLISPYLPRQGTAQNPQRATGHLH